MNFKRFAINIYRREFDRVHLPFPGQTIALDTLYDKQSDIARKYPQAIESASYLARAIRNQARRDAQSALRLHAYYESAISEIIDREAHDSMEHDVDVRVTLERAIAEIQRLPEKQRLALGAVMQGDRCGGRTLERARDEIRRICG